MTYKCVGGTLNLTQLQLEKICELYHQYKSVVWDSLLCTLGTIHVVTVLSTGNTDLVSMWCWSLTDVGIGEVAVLRRGDRYIYYLVTKDRYFHKPKLDNLRRSLQCTQAHCQRHGITRLAMPRIGCGLDKLNWTEVSQLLDEIFVSSGINVTVYSL